MGTVTGNCPQPQIERGESNVSLVNIHRIAEALGVDAAELFRS